MDGQGDLSDQHVEGDPLSMRPLKVLIQLLHLRIVLKWRESQEVIILNDLDLVDTCYSKLLTTQQAFTCSKY